MGKDKKPKRSTHNTQQLTLSPPAALEDGQYLAAAVKAEGNNLWTVRTATQESRLVELPARFRNTVWIRRGAYVLVDATKLADRENKLAGVIENVVVDRKAWMRMDYWPQEFTATASQDSEEESEEESNVGKLPPGSDDEE